MRRIIGRHIVLFLGLALVACCSANSQDIGGRLFGNDGPIENVHVVNMNKNEGTISNKDGYFEISVNINDTLLFSALQYKRKKIVVTEEIYKSEFITIELEISLTELDEVVVRPYSLTGDIANDIDSLNIGKIV